MMKMGILAFVILASIVLSAQAGTVIDGFGDARDPFNAGPPLFDIDTLSALVIGTDLSVTMTFHTPISATSLLLPDSVIGLVEFDTDMSSLTGIPALQNSFESYFSTSSLGIDFVVSLATEIGTPGFVTIFDTSSFTPTGSVPITFGPTSFSMLIPLAMLGGDDGIVDQTAIIGTFAQPTDAIGTIPEPSTFAFLGLGLLGLAAARRRRRT